VAKKKARAYRSPLRAAQAEATRERILDATLRVLDDGAAAFTVPAVSAEAEVSPATIYRLFTDKETLLESARARARQLLGVEDRQVSSTEEFIAQQTRHIHSVSQADESVARALFTLSTTPLPPEGVEARQRYIREGLADEFAGIDDDAREHLVRSLAMLYGSAGAMMLWRFRLMNDDGAETFAWIVRALMRAAKLKGSDDDE
jgi:AcrR family transcriptional regulator